MANNLSHREIALVVLGASDAMFRLDNAFRDVIYRGIDFEVAKAAFIGAIEDNCDSVFASYQKEMERQSNQCQDESPLPWDGV